ncbi:inovirus-type Gp2 protein [Psychromonas sp. MME2]|uniref:YagK/YfjJ domain-containing protein n=1 Tax=unclassified Psychromonas TaxID=2614957 RepID=UPI00339BD16B
MSKYKSENPIYRTKNKVFRVNSGKNKPIFTHQMRKIIEQMENTITKHSRTFIVVFDLRVATFSSDNNGLKILLSKLRFYLRRYYNIKRLGYTWCREQYKSSKQHYHMALMLDGSKIQYPHKLLKTISSMWHDITDGGHLYTPKNCYYMIKRGDPSFEETKAEAIYRLSYQAKVKTKEKNTASTNDYGTSQLKQNK